MRKEHIILLLILGSLFSCETKNHNWQIEHIPGEWKDIQDLKGEWLELERDEQGYFLYEPCDGGTPGLEIDSNFIVLKHQIEEPTNFEITRSEITADGILIYAMDRNLEAEFIFKTVDKEKGLVLFKWRYPRYQTKGKMVITRLEIAEKIRLVKNPCDTEEVPDQDFLPVEFD